MSDRLRRDGLSRFAEVAARHVGDDTVPGLVGLVACGGQVHVEALGSLSIGGRAVERSSLFRIASTTKPITAVATLALAAEGRLDLDESVERLLPELAGRRVLRRMDGPLDETVPARRPVTVRDLLTFTFGFGIDVAMLAAPEPWPVAQVAAELQLSAFGPPDPARQPDPDTWIARFGSLPLMAQPGDRWLYNTGASVLGVLVARAAGVSLAEVLRTRVFEPLGMGDTGMWTPEPDRLAAVYMSGPDGLAVWDPPGGAWSAPPVFGDGAGGLVSTVDDLLALARMLLGDGDPMLTSEAVKEMTGDQLTAGQKVGTAPLLDGRGWGLGLSVVTDGPRAGAFGWDGGLGTSWLVDPNLDLTVIVLTQRMFETAQAPKVHEDLQAAAYAAVSRD